MRNAFGIFALILLVGGCNSEAPPAATTAARRVETAAVRDQARIVVLGDSLTAGLGLPADEAFPAVLQRRIDNQHLNYEVVNAGVSGDTTAGGLRRLDWVLAGDVRVLIVALGANDGLRGLPATEIHSNLSDIVSAARRRGVAVLLAGMEAPPNFGAEYTAAFRRVYRDVAREQGVPLIPFLLQGVAGQPSLNQADGIHPNAEGARRVADVVWPALQPLLVDR